MEEPFFLPPRAQALGKYCGFPSGSPLGLGRRRSRTYKFACRLNRRRFETSFALLSCLLAAAVTGCGANYVVDSAAISSFQASTDSVEFGTVAIGSTANSTLSLVNQGSTPVDVSSVKVTGNVFSITNASTDPISIAANGGTYNLDVQFKPNAGGDANGQLLISSTSSKSPSLKIKLHGKGSTSTGGSNGTSSAVSALSCGQSSFAGAGTDSCAVSLNAAAGSGGLAVSLSSNNSAVAVPGSVTVPAGASSAAFTATVSAVTSAQSATLTASAGGATQTYAIALGTAVPALTLNTASLSFGSVTVNSSSTPQSVTLTSSGTAPLTINSAAVTGAGFSVSGMSFPTTLNPGQKATLSVVFHPTTAGTVSGSITLTDNSSPSTATISLSGTGQTVSSGGSLSTLSCASASMTGAGSDACTVSLSAAASSGGLAISLSSNNSAVSVPGSVTVAAGATSATFAATVSAVTSPQTATVTASAGGTTRAYAIALGAAVPALTLSTTSLNFGSVAVNSSSAPLSVTLTSAGTAPLTIGSAGVTGAFSVSGMSFPATLNPGQKATLSVVFHPTTSGTATGTITLSDNASPSTVTIGLSGTGQSTTGSLAGLSCTTTSFTAAGSDVCKVTLNAAAGTGGLAVSLSSNNSAVTVPGSVTVAAGATSAAFTATVSAVTSTQSAILTATASGSSLTLALQLSAATPTLTLNATSIAFGDVSLNTPATQSLVLSSTGTTAVTINSASLTGTGFSMSGVTFPVTLNPGQQVTLNIQFDPTTAGSVTGKLTITSNSSSNSTAQVTLSGNGVATSYSVDLTWSAPSSSTDPVAGYHVYRAANGSTTYQLLNSTLTTTTTYSDTKVSSGTSYSYYVVSVDSGGTESSPSNTWSTSIP